MDTQILIQMVKKLNHIEQKEKSQAEAELQFNIQHDIEKEKLSKDKRQTRWILGLPGGSLD